MKRAIFALAVLIGAAWAGRAISAEEIIRAMERNQVHDTAEADGTLVITDRFGSRTKTFKSFSAGEDKMLIAFTNAEEKGQKILKLQEEIYLYFPEAEEIVHLQGGALKQSVMGSDFSYEDLTGEKGLLSLYDASLLGEEELDGRRTYHLRLKGKKSGVAYPLEEIWVDAELMVLKKANLYALSGKLLKDLVVKEVKRIGGKNVPVAFLMRDKMKKVSSTEFKLANLRIDQGLPPKIFSRENLSW